MASNDIQFHKIWVEQCEAAETIRDQSGLQNALDYLIGEKLFTFVHAAETTPEFAAELPNFVAAIRAMFTTQEICSYLDDLERSKFLSPPDADEDTSPDEDELDDVLPDKPILGAQELLRFARIKEMLQAGV
ncbi:MAG: hypothetical protein CXZ00_15640 [Acidobacteria bacterium]|nr:MAG: hypothetical protein CXZ00_15640 [Acidobacteriota bacterium]